MEEELSEAETKIAELEYTLFTELREHISKNIAKIFLPFFETSF